MSLWAVELDGSERNKMLARCELRLVVKPYLCWIAVSIFELNSSNGWRLVQMGTENVHIHIGAR